MGKKDIVEDGDAEPYCFDAFLINVLSCFLLQSVVLCRTLWVVSPSNKGSHRSHGLGYALSPKHSHVLPCLRKSNLFILKIHRGLKRGQSELSVQLTESQPGVFKIPDRICIGYFVLLNNIPSFLVDHSLVS